MSLNTRISAKTGGGQQLTLKVKNQVTNAFDTTSVNGLSIGALPFDSVGNVIGNLADYVGGGGAIQGRIEVRVIGIQTVAFPCTEFDSANMVVTG